MMLFRRLPFPRLRKRLFWLLLILFYFCLPRNLFRDPYARVMEDREGELLMATIANDGQWRFPMGKLVPPKYETALIAFEDKRFYHHFGISIPAIARAMSQNIKAGHVVSGGSTISMQVIRMSRKREGRSITDKLTEMFMAVRLEFRYSKKEILEMYAAHAPFGGNVVGLDAACWRYFGHKSQQLSWSEAALLAVLPNAPALIHPGRNRKFLMEKRNRLLRKLYENGSLSEMELESALMEPLPEKPKPLPQLTPHLLANKIQNQPKDFRFKTSVDRDLQVQLNRLSARYQEHLSMAGIRNHGIVVMEIKTGNVIAYVGNAEGTDASPFVDVVQAPRSTGSILKPFLYAGAMQQGLITPKMLMPDYPTRIHGYTPENYEKTFDGMVPADEALSRSLNIPAVRLLSDYGVSRFKSDGKKLGITTFFRPAEEYGLSLILGGAEATLYQLAGAYRKVAQSAIGESQVFDQAVAYEVLTAMTAVNRPGFNQYWDRFDHQRKVAWKTGTSFGARDAWAIGVTPEYVVGVWAGNADGEGIAGMTGSNTAGPILFDVYRLLPTTGWFDKPVRDMQMVEVCSESGHRAGIHCPNAQKRWLPNACLKSKACPYHKLVPVENGANSLVPGKPMQVSFILPAAAAHYYKNRHPEYESQIIPVSKANGKSLIDVLYPQQDVKIRLPKLATGDLAEVVFEAVHRNKKAELYWFVDNSFITSTKDIHQIRFQPSAGKHELVVTDENGLTLKRRFEVSLSASSD
ncbi:MAG: penicillin-binding protein 1C [Bacteroidetes bacterium]|nr:penicillin-binding protein 1C [Bacteroidota bacterium]